jgi:hypothetical protein
VPQGAGTQQPALPLQASPVGRRFDGCLPQVQGGGSIRTGFHVIANVDKLRTNEDRAFSKYGMEKQMASIVGRREFLAGSAALAGAAMGSGFTCVEVASAAPIEVPTIYKLSIRVLLTPRTIFSCARQLSTASACSRPRSRAAFPT